MSDLRGIVQGIGAWPRRFASAIVATSLLFLFASGGQAVAGVRADVKVGTWRHVHAVPSPPARWLSTMAYDPETAEIVLFGGQLRSPQSTTASVNDTWVWAKSSWQRVRSFVAPPPRFTSTMAYSPHSKAIILFGGTNTTRDSVFGDTWEWNGQWTQLHPATSPPARFGAQMALDAQTGDDVLFGGVGGASHGSTAKPLDDTWEWTGTDWVQLSPATSPPPITHGAMAWSTVGKTAVLFGRPPDHSSGPSVQTWLWNGSTWSRWTGRRHPSRRASLSETSLGSGGVLLYGGITFVRVAGTQRQTWLWGRGGWRRLKVRRTPGTIIGGAMAYSTRDHKVLLFGTTRNIHSGPGKDDTWLLPVS